MNIDEVISILESLQKEDLDPHTGKLFAYVYETGDENLRRVAIEALKRYSEKNMLDFTVFKSVIYFEKEVINYAKKLMHGDDNVVGSYTFGGTESIMLAVKAARDHFRKRRGKVDVPELLAPITIHPSFLKAADYLGLRVKRLPIVDTKADVDAFNENISDNTALVALSAPNWPYGSIDPVKDIAEVTGEKGVWLHVDACLGGFILPFFEELGEKLPLYDFRVEGVTSISLDAHKYGYAPKGASIVLFRNPDYKKYSMFVDVSSGGYIFVNEAVLSSRPEGPLAAAYAVIKYLGDEGYRRLASKVLDARNRILEGLSRLGFKSVGPVESSILSLYSDVDLLGFVNNLREMGWQLHLQRGIEEYGIPDNIHLTISPIHHKVVDEFLRDAEEALRRPPKISGGDVARMIEEGRLDEIIKAIESGELDSSAIQILLKYFPEDLAVEMIKEVVIQWFK